MNIGEPVKSKSHEDASDYNLQLNRWFLKMVGAWPRSATTTIKERVISIILIFTCYSLITFTVLPCVLNVLLEETDLQVKLRAIGPLSHWFLAGMNYSSLLLRAREIRHCVQHIKTDWQTVTEIEDRQVMLKYVNFGRVATGLCVIFMYSGVFSHNVMQGVMSTIICVDNESVSIHLLPCPTYSKFIDIRYSPGGEIALILQLLSSIVVNTITISACSLAAVFAMHACGQLNVLMRWLDQVVDERKEQNTIRQLAIIVEHHLRILSFIARMEALLTHICFVELLECTFNLCMSGYYVITTWNVIDTKLSVAYAFVYVSMGFNIFIFCYIGDILTEQCKQVGEAIYMTNWYYLPHKTVRDLIFIITRSNIVTKLTAGKLVHLSIPTFATVIKTSTVYLNMLRTITAL